MLHLSPIHPNNSRAGLERFRRLTPVNRAQKYLGFLCPVLERSSLRNIALFNKVLTPMPILTHTPRFGGLPAVRLANLYAVLFQKSKFGFHRHKSVPTKRGICDITALNIGRFLFMWERPTP